MDAEGIPPGILGSTAVPSRTCWGKAERSGASERFLPFKLSDSVLLFKNNFSSQLLPFRFIIRKRKDLGNRAQVSPFGLE